MPSFTLVPGGKRDQQIMMAGYARFVSGKNGLATVSLLDNGAWWLTIWIIDEDHPQGFVAYQEELFTEGGP